MNGIWGIRELSKEAVVNKEVLVTMRKRVQIKEKYQDGNFLMGNTGFGYWLTDAVGFDSNYFPFCNEDSTVYAFSAGTIYNCSELRSDLEKNGHKFHTAIDAEVVVHLYEEFGEEFAAKLYGNFVIVLWDKTKGSLILSRDQLGVRPLYYTVVNNKLIFASEIKLILAHPDVRAQVDPFALSEYFTFEYVPGPKTIYARINKLLPAQLLICKDEKIELKKYWQIHYQESELNEDEICRQIITRLKESIKYCLGGSRIKGVLLSGGIDSSTLVALMRDLGCEGINTFSAIFKEKAFNESSSASLVAKYFNTKHHQILIEPKVILDSLAAEIYGQFDEPLADASVMPTYLVANLARKEGMDVCISGDGGDELFGGYDTYAALRFLKYASNLPPLLKSTFNRIIDLLPSYNYRGINFKIKKFKEGIDLPPELAYYAWWGAYSSREQKKLFTEEMNNALGVYDSFRVIYQYLSECNGWDLLNKVFYMDLKFNLPDGSLRKSERVATINSLEGRPPFLYPSLVELSSSIPHHLKVRGLTKKYIFKKSIKPYLPAKIINVPKKGFDIPLEDWIRKDLRNFVIDSLSKDIIKKQGFLDYAYIERLLKEHFSGKINHRQKIWPIVVFTSWYRAAFD